MESYASGRTCEAVHMLLRGSYAKHQRLLMNAEVDVVATADAARLRQVLATAGGP